MILEYYLEPGAIAPMFAHKDSDAGMDLYTPVNVTIYPMKQEVIDTKVRVFISQGYYGAIVPKSGLALEGITITNSPGTIDSGYIGTIKAIIYNSGKFTKDFRAGDKICQLIIKKREKVDMKQVYEIPETIRGENGFGSTGK
jgi:dUTP pyrophosphatase